MGKEGHIGIVKSAVKPIQPVFLNDQNEYHNVETPQTHQSQRKNFIAQPPESLYSLNGSNSLNSIIGVRRSSVGALTSHRKAEIKASYNDFEQEEVQTARNQAKVTPEQSSITSIRNFNNNIML